MLQDVVRYEGFVDARVFVRFQVDEGIFSQTLSSRFFCRGLAVSTGIADTSSGGTRLTLARLHFGSRDGRGQRVPCIRIDFDAEG